MNQQVTISPLTEDNVPRDYKMIQQNEKYLERHGEGYPNLKNANDYYRYLLNIYGDFQNIAMKRFTISYSGAPVGQIGLHSFCIHNFTCQAEIFYWIDEEFQGKGIVTTACKLLQKHAFEVLGLELLIIHCLVENVKSAKVAERCGFDFEGITKYAQEYKKYVKTVEKYYRS